jgi:hypothetical protein
MRSQGCSGASPGLCTAYVRAGTYKITAPIQTNDTADDGETISYYLADPIDGAVFDGSGVSQFIFGIAGTSKFTINGLSMTNALWGGVKIYGGVTDARDHCTCLAHGTGGTCVSAVRSTAADNVVKNNQIFSMANPTSPDGTQFDVTEGAACNPTGVEVVSSAPGNLITNNYIHDMPYRGVDLRNPDVGIASGARSVYFSDSKVTNNYFQNICVIGVDCGVIYAWNPYSNSSATGQTTGKATGWVVDNNYINTFESTLNPGISVGQGGSGHALYCDYECGNGTWTHNVIVGSTNAIAFITNDGSGNTFEYNVWDLGSGNLTAIWLTDSGDGHHIGTPGNVWQNNVVISDSAAAPDVQGLGISVGGVPYDAQSNGGAPNPTAPSYGNNLYVQLNASGPYYNTGTAAYGFSDTTSSAAFTHSSTFGLECWQYQTVTGSLAAATIPGGIPGAWGPPGFVVPKTGGGKPSIPIPVTCP